MERSGRARKKQPFEIPEDILESIFKRLPLIDILRAKAVCSSWKSTVQALLSSNSDLSHFKIPWLLLPPKKSKSGGAIASPRIMNLEENRVYVLNSSTQSSTLGRYLHIGSSHGWLIMADGRSIVYLLNPFTLATIQLPQLNRSLLTEPDDYLRRKDYWDTTYIPPQLLMVKAILTGEPNLSGNNNYSVILIYSKKGLYKRIAYLKNKQGPWTELDGNKYASYSDIMCHGNKLFGLTISASIDIWDFQGPQPEKRILEIKPSHYIQSNIDTRNQIRNLTRNPSGNKRITNTIRRKHYLVELHGEILLARRFVVLRQGDHQIPHKTQLFQVYKLNFDEQKWVNVESLGDYSLFLGGNESATISTKNSSTCKANSVYFTDDGWFRRIYGNETIGGRDMGIYNIEDGSIEEIYEIGRETINIDPSPCWLVPHLS
ncbi:hypothetical protein SLA2020_116340 [Shorea laevis]